MSNQFVVLVLILLFVVGTTIAGMAPGIKARTMNLEQWAVGGRVFGRWLTWFVAAGEIFNAFAFLGASGWAYSRGGPTFYILSYGALAFLIGYYMLPVIAEIGRKHQLMTQPDLFEHMYQSRNLGIFSAVIGIAFLLPYLQLQLAGLGLIIETCSYGSIPHVPAMIISFAMVAGFIYLSGLKGVATTAVIKDIVMICAVAFFGIYLPYHYFGGVGKMFATLDVMKPGFLTLPGATKNLDSSWVMSTMALSGLGLYCWPHFCANCYSAKNPNVLRHNAVYLPLYQFALLFPMLVGFCALMVLPSALKVPDMAFMAIVRHAFPGWTLGLVGGAGALACMIPASYMILSTSLLFTKNIYGKVAGPSATPERIKKLARFVVLGLTAIALMMTILTPNMLVNLLLTGYSGITQFFPMLMIGLCWRKANKYGAFAGLIVGEILVFTLILSKLDPLAVGGLHLNAGFVALAANLVVFVVVSMATYDAQKESGVMVFRAAAGQ